MNETIERARVFAIAAHTAIGQRRKYTNAPYSCHCENVANIVTGVKSAHNLPTLYNMIAAAWLHDVVEDTQITIGDIQMQFGDSITRLVYQLTDISKKSDGNRATRKRIDAEHYKDCSYEAATIKMADLIDNLGIGYPIELTLKQQDRGFFKVFMQEKALLLPYLSHGDVELYAKCENYLKQNS